MRAIKASSFHNNIKDLSGKRLSSKCPDSLHPHFLGPRSWIETGPCLGKPVTLSDGLEVASVRPSDSLVPQPDRVRW
jgi:hypothetical protein